MMTRIIKEENTTHIYVHINVSHSKSDLYQFSKHIFGHFFGQGHRQMDSPMSPMLTTKHGNTFTNGTK